MCTERYSYLSRFIGSCTNGRGEEVACRAEGAKAQNAIKPYCGISMLDTAMVDAGPEEEGLAKSPNAVLEWRQSRLLNMPCDE